MKLSFFEFSFRMSCHFPHWEWEKRYCPDLWRCGGWPICPLGMGKRSHLRRLRSGVAMAWPILLGLHFPIGNWEKVVRLAWLLGRVRGRWASARGFSRVFWGFSRPWPSRIEFPWVFGRRELALGSPPGRAQNAKSHIGGLIGNGLVWRAGRFRILALKNTGFSRNYGNFVKVSRVFPNGNGRNQQT